MVVCDNGNLTSSVEALDPEVTLGIVEPNSAIAEGAREAKQRMQRNARSTPAIADERTCDGCQILTHA